jgi:hypothetical protein
MSRNVLIASLAGAVALGLSAFTAQAASVPVHTNGVHTAKVSLVQQARFDRHHRYYRYHRHHRRYWPRWL